jgi:hypothetical protein
MAVRRGEWGFASRAGAIAGIVGGLVLAVLALIVTVAQGQDLWSPMKFAALPFLGDRAMEPGFDAGAVILGLLSHFAVSIGWGVLFGWIAFGLSSTATVALGLAWGIVVWLGMYYVVMPVVGLGEIAAAAPVGFAVFQHLAFGLGVGLGFLPYQRPRAAEAMRPLPTVP